MPVGSVICSIERLFDWESNGEAVLGVTLSAAWGDPSQPTPTDAPPGTFLLPWTWQGWDEGPDGMQFYLGCVVTNNSSVAPYFTPQPIRPINPKWEQGNISTIRPGSYQAFAVNVLKPQYDRISQNLANLGYSKQGDSLTINSSDTVDDTSFAKGAKWPSVLADLSTRPAPIPHALLLSFILPPVAIAGLLPKLPDGTFPAPQDCSLFAAPVVPSAALTPHATLTPVTSEAALTRDADQVTMHWAYSDANYEAQSQTISLGAAPPRKSFFDLGSRLVKSPNGEAWHFSEDWQASFESRLGERLDLSGELQRILENETVTDSNSRLLADAAIAALRDVAGLGCDPGPGNGTFLETIPGFDPSQLPSIRAAAAANASLNSITGWKLFLQSAFQTPETTLSDSYLGALPLWGSSPLSQADAALQLNRLRQKILTPENLWALLQAQATLAGAGVLTLPSDLKALPAALRAENLGRYWRKGLRDALASPAGAYNSGAIRDALATKLEVLAISRFKDTVNFLPGVAPAVAAAAATALSSATTTSKNDWKAAALYAIPLGNTAKAGTPGNNTAKLSSQGITIQINELGASHSAPAGEVADVRKLQGAGLLLAYENQPDGTSKPWHWRCLNYADVYYADQQSNSLLELQKGVVAPLRFSWHNDVAVATVSYNNESMSTPGPLSRAAKSALQNPGSTEGSEISVATDLFIYQYPTSGQTDDPKTQVTPLVFGRNYRPQPFLISNAGVLPNAVANGNYFEIGSDLDSRAALGDTWSGVPYRRSKAPGPLRLSSLPDPIRPFLQLPQIPQGVFPRMQSSLVPAPQLASGATPPLVQQDQPVLLLAPNDRARFTSDLPAWFDLVVRPPSLDLSSWDRFVNGFGNSLAAKRETVISSYLTKFRTGTDVTLDDPATIADPGYDCRLYVELLDDSDATVQKGFLQFPPPSGGPVPGAQSPGARFHFSAVADPTVSSGSGPMIDKQLNDTTPVKLNAGDIVTVSVSEGRLAKLRLHACVSRDYENRFEAGVLSNAGVLNGNWYFLNPTEIQIEIVTDNLPGASDIFTKTAFQVGQFDLLNGAAPVSLDLTGIKFEPYVYGAEVLRQVWKWQGRPVTMPPLTEGSDRNNWLGNEFGNRTDFLRSAMTPPAPGSAARKFTYIEDRGSLLTAGARASSNIERPPSTVAVPADIGLLGTYIRYGVMVFSRYQPVCVNSGYQTGQDSSRVIWRDLFIPSRKTTQIKPPDVKMILPLTRNAADSQAGPGLLVMLRGPWFQECGLGEQLEARLTVVEKPEENPAITDVKTFYYQYGPDPILSNGTTLNPVRLQNPNTAETGWATAKINGPIGHTFDSVTADQLFVNTSFVLDYPRVENSAWTPWSFCKLQVRRVVDTGNGVTPRPGSEWSPATWVQLLPDFDRYSPTDAFSGLILAFDSSNKTFTLTKEKIAVNLPAGNSDTPIFANYLAITHFVADATGVPVQEAFDGLYRQSGTAWISMGTPPNVEGQQPIYRARVITVQGKSPAAATVEDDFWNELFAIDKSSDGSGVFVRDIDRLRIVGVSRPIDTDAAYRGC
jgi:hypothetical protein